MNMRDIFVLPKNFSSDWVELRLPGAELTAEILGTYLVESGARGLVIEEKVLRVFIPTALWSEIDPDELAAKWENLKDIDQVFNEKPKLFEVEEEDWVARWRKSLGPIRVGKKLVVLPPEVEYQAEPDDIVLLLEPRMAFGTGEHPTTQMALELIEDIVDKNTNVLDLGCGNGILALGALKLGAHSVTCIDNEDESIQETTENLEKHGYLSQAEIIQDDATELNLNKKFSLVIANILFRPIQKALAGWTDFSEKNCHLILTGIRVEEESEIIRELALSLGWHLDLEKSSNEWYAARFVKE